MTDEQAVAVSFALKNIESELLATWGERTARAHELGEHESALRQLLADYYSQKETASQPNVRDPRDPNGMTLEGLRQMRAAAMAEGLRGL